MYLSFVSDIIYRNKFYFKHFHWGTVNIFFHRSIAILLVARDSLQNVV